MFFQKKAGHLTLVISAVMTCIFWLFLGLPAQSALTDEYENELLQKLKNIQAQIQTTKAELSRTQSESQTLSREVRLYDTKIKTLSLQISETDILLIESQLAIDNINAELALIDASIGKEKTLLVASMRAIDRYNDNFLNILARTDSISDFFNEMNALKAVNDKIASALREVKASKEEYRKIKDGLEAENEEYLLLKSAQGYQKMSLNDQKNQKNTLLQKTKGKESEFQKMIAEQEKTAAEISNQLFVLQNMGGSLKFDEAAKLAKYAGEVVGIRPAFLLAILSKESNIGKFVGSGNWRDDMYNCYVSLGKKSVAEKQKTAFFEITEKLNLDPDNMAVSKEPTYGCGGAMGAAQFLPATWLAYEEQIALYTGHRPPNPWNITDAFVASALYLRDLGAGAKTETAEWTAAMKYLAGSNWQKPSLRFYGDHVMEIAVKIQKDIDILERG